MPVNNLRIVNSAQKISSDGYVSVFDRLTSNQSELDNFERHGNSYQAARADDLAHYARYRDSGATQATGGRLVQRNTADTDDEDVSGNNCKIRAHKDKPHTGGPNSYTRVTVPLPEQRVIVTELGYIDDYVKEFLEIWNTGTTLPAPTSNATRDKARKFMFSVFMLTKCR